MTAIFDYFPNRNRVNIFTVYITLIIQVPHYKNQWLSSSFLFIFKASTAKVAGISSAQKVIGACCSSNLSTWWHS